jgi:hypothetical protein
VTGEATRVCVRIDMHKHRSYRLTDCSPREAYMQQSQVLYSVGPNNGYLIVVYPLDIVKDVVAEKQGSDAEPHLENSGKVHQIAMSLLFI